MITESRRSTKLANAIACKIRTWRRRHAKVRGGHYGELLDAVLNHIKPELQALRSLQEAKTSYKVWIVVDAAGEPIGMNHYGLLSAKAKRDACKKAAEHFGFATFTEAKRKGWCDVVEAEFETLGVGRKINA